VKTASDCQIIAFSYEIALAESNGDVRILIEIRKRQFVRMHNTALAKTAQNDW